MEYFVQYIGTLGPYLLFLLSILYLWSHRMITYLQYFGMGAAFNLLVNFAVKIMVQQPRPKEDLTIGDNKFEFGLSDLKTRKGSDRYGMPSGHAQTTAYSLAFMAPVFARNAAANASTLVFSFLFAVYLIIGTITIIQRVMYKHHTVLQMLVGLILGGIIGLSTYQITKYKIQGALRPKKDDGRLQ